jgi:ribosomal protein S18 acetylase RimI-like enzyme
MPEVEAAVAVALDEAPSRDDLQVLRRGLDRYNAQQGLPEEGRAPFAAFARRGDRIVGGAAGDVRWGWLKIKYLWVDEALRGQGWGRALMEQAERWAVRRGCRALRLSTYSFQALGFYEKLGFEVQFEVADYPEGHSKYYLVKPLRTG